MKMAVMVLNTVGEEWLKKKNLPKVNYKIGMYVKLMLVNKKLINK